MLAKLNRLVFSILFSVYPPLLATPFKAAETPCFIGETGNLFLLKSGFYSRPFYNDVFGNTDKHLSGSSQIGYLKISDEGSFDIKSQWLLITPTYKEQFGAEKLISPVGRFADLVETKGSWAKIFKVNQNPVRLQFTFGLSDIGNHGGKEMHFKFHQLIRTSTQNLDYTEQPKGVSMRGGMEVGLISEKYRFMGYHTESILRFGYYSSEFMQDLYLNQNAVYQLSQSLKVGVETSLIRQLGSEVYGNDVLDWRFEFSSGILYGWYRPSIKYVSAHLRDDQVGQLYFDPLAFYVAF